MREGFRPALSHGRRRQHRRAVAFEVSRRPGSPSPTWTFPKLFASWKPPWFSPKVISLREGAMMAEGVPRVKGVLRAGTIFVNAVNQLLASETQPHPTLCSSSRALSGGSQ